MYEEIISSQRLVILSKLYVPMLIITLIFLQTTLQQKSLVEN